MFLPLGFLPFSPEAAGSKSSILAILTVQSHLLKFAAGCGDKSSESARPEQSIKDSPARGRLAGVRELTTGEPMIRGLLAAGSSQTIGTAA
jgi:hypothetical protein